MTAFGRRAPAGDEQRLDRQQPWPGLASFTEENRGYFFGRDREIEDLGRIVRQETLTVLFGRSGLGKSSLLRAGLAPLLREQGFVPIYIRLHHEEEELPLEDQVEVQIEETLATWEIDGPQPIREETLWEYFHKLESDWWDSENQLVKPVLIFDQFEELLTIGQEGAARKARTNAFLTELEDLVENRPPAALRERLESQRGLAAQYDFEREGYRVVLSLREDYLADLEGLNDRLRSIMRNRFRLLPMSGEQAMQAILGPGGHLIEEEVAVRIVDFVSSSGSSGQREARTRKEIADRHVEPALLSVVLRELNRRRLDVGKARITQELLGRGRAAEILEDFCERGLEGMDESVGEFIAERLLTESGARNRVAEEDALTEPGISAAVIDTLVDRRIIQRVSTGRLKWLELTHDTLADVVKGRRTEHRRRREVAAAEAREAEVREKLSRTRRLVASFAALLVAVVVLGLWAGVSARENATLGENLAETVADLESSNADLEEQARALSEANTALATTNRELQARAEREAEAMVEQMREELDRMSPGVGGQVSDWLSRIRADTEQFDSGRLRTLDALAHALGASLLYAYGQIDAGMSAAEYADAGIPSLQSDGPSGSGSDLILAETTLALATGLFETGRLGEAESQFRAAMELSETLLDGPLEDPEAPVRIYALSQIGLGKVQQARYRRDDAIRAYSGFLDWLGAGTPPLPSGSAQHDHWRVLALSGIAGSEARFEASRPYFGQARGLLERLRDASPDNLLWLTLSVDLGYREAFTMMGVVPPSEVQATVGETLAAAETLHELDPENLRWRHLLARAHRARGMLHEKTEEDARATESYAHLREQSRYVHERQPRWWSNRQLHAVSYYYCGGSGAAVEAAGESDCGSAGADGASSASVDAYREMAALLEEMARSVPESAGVRRDAAVAHSKIGDELTGLAESLPDPMSAAAEAHRYEAAGVHRRAIALMEALDPEVQLDPYFASVTAYAQERLADVLEATDRPAESIVHYREAVRLREAIAVSRAMPGDFDAVGITRFNLAVVHASSGDEGGAAEEYLRSLAAYDDGLEAVPGDAMLLSKKAYMAWLVAYRLTRLGRYALATEILEEGAEAGRAAFAADPLSYEVVQRLESLASEVDSLETRLGEPTQNEPTLVDGDGDGYDPDELIARLEQVRSELGLDRILQPDQDAAAAAGTAGGGFTWVHPPLVAGAWRTLEPTEAKAAVEHLAEMDATQELASRVVKIRTMRPSFYPGADLYEAEVRTVDSGDTGILAYVRLGEETLILDGTSPPSHIFAFNPGALEIRSPAQALEYLHFFMSSVSGEEGNFRMVGAPGELSFVEGSDAVRIAEARERITPPTIRERSNGMWEARGTFRYGQHLFYGMLRVDPNGRAEMTLDQPATGELPVMSEQYDAEGLRILVAPGGVAADAEPTPEALATAVRAHANAGRWPQAAQTQGELVELMLDRLEEGDATADAVAGQLINLAFYRLFVSDFGGSLSASEAALGLGDTSREVLIDTNRAHALLFLGRVEDAELVYRKHRGRSVVPGDPTLWEEAISSDLDRLAEAGVTHPEVQRIRTILEGR